MKIDAACKKCNSGKEKEVISDGIAQVVYWDGEYIVREETTFQKNSGHAKYYCDNPECPDYGKEV